MKKKVVSQEYNVKFLWMSQALFLGVLIFAPLAFAGTESWSSALIQFSIFLSAILILISAPEREAHGITWSVGALLLFILLGILQWQNSYFISCPKIAAPFTAYKFGTSRAILIWMSWTCLIWTLGVHFQNQAFKRRFSWVLFGLGTTIAVVGLIQLAGGNAAYYGLRPARPEMMPFGPFPNDNHAANYLTMTAFVGIGLGLEYFSRIPKREGIGKKSDLIAIGVLLLFFVGIIFFAVVKTDSRAAILAAAVAGWITAILATTFCKTRARAWAARTILAALAAAFVAWLFMDVRRIGYIGTGIGTSTRFRLWMLDGGVKIFLEYPIFGTGLGSISEVFPAYQDVSLTGFVRHLHNDWVQLLAETGTIGSMFLGFGILAALLDGGRNWLTSHNPQSRYVMGGVFASLLFFMIHSLFDFSLQIPANAFLFFSLLTFNAVTPSMRPNPASRDARHGKKKIFIASLMGLLSLYALTPIPAAYNLRLAKMAAPEQKEIYLNRSLKWLDDPKTHYLLGRNYLERAAAPRANGIKLLRMSLKHTERSLSVAPLNIGYLRLHSVLLDILGRPFDIPNPRP